MWLQFLLQAKINLQQNFSAIWYALFFHRIFGYKEQDAEDIMFVNWLHMARAGLMGLEFYTPETKKWRQVRNITQSCHY